MATISEVPASRGRRGWLYLVGALGLLLFMGMCGSILNNNTSTTAAPSNRERQQTVAIRHKIDDNVSVGYWSYRCNSTDWRRSIGGEYTREYPDASFLVVNLSVRNNDKSASVLSPLKLVDAQGLEYDESSKGIFLENSFGVLKNINPGVTSHGNIVFDVPRSGKYMLKVSGGFTSGESALIDLQ